MAEESETVLPETSAGNAPPLFVVGAPRSGTSLLRNLVRSCEGVYLPPDETQFIPAYIELVERRATTKALVSLVEHTAFCRNMRRRGFWPSRPDLMKVFENSNPAVAIPKLMRELADCEGLEPPKIWGDKTPRYIHFLERLRESFPDARFIVVLRDPRDAVLSMSEAWGRSLGRGAIVWREAARIADREINLRKAPDTILVRYEDIALNPEQTMLEVAKWLGAAFSPATLEEYVGEEKWGAARGDKVVTTSIGRFREKLSGTDVALIESIALAEMQSMGYAPERAKEPYSPTRMQQWWWRISDAAHSLHSYAAENGVISGVSYKMRQFIVSRRADDR
jgi:Sulfotransferase family